MGLIDHTIYIHLYICIDNYHIYTYTCRICIFLQWSDMFSVFVGKLFCLFKRAVIHTQLTLNLNKYKLTTIYIVKQSANLTLQKSMLDKHIVKKGHMC